MRDPNGPPVTPDGASGGGGAAAAAAAERVVHPIEKGSVVDWDVLEACLDHVLYDRVSLQQPERCCCRPCRCCQAAAGSTAATPAAAAHSHATSAAFACCPPPVQIGWQRGREGGVLLAEPNFVSREERERLCQLMFEVFNLSGYYAADQAVLSLYGLGRVNGTVVDIGYGKIGGWMVGKSEACSGIGWRCRPALQPA